MNETHTSAMGNGNADPNAVTTPLTPRSAPPQNPSDLPEIPGFEIRGRLGAAGQGQVYRAFHRQLQCEVALKIPHRDDGVAREQFLNEARALAQVHHPNVVGVRDFGETDTQVYFTMDLIEGPNLADLIKRFDEADARHADADALLGILQLDPEQATSDVRRALAGPQPYFRLVALWIAQAAEGLAAAFAKGILHRDIKPSNLILGPDGRLIVVDFGLARSLQMLPSPHASGVTGTYPYIAPERAAGDWAAVDHRADIWALGATLYELLTFQRAYSRRGREVLLDITTRAPDSPRRIVRAIPAELEQVCLRAMARDPLDRFEGWSALAERVRNWLDAPPAKTRAPAIATTVLLAGIAGAAIWFGPQLLTAPSEAPARASTPTGVVADGASGAEEPASADVDGAVAEPAVDEPGDAVAAGGSAAPAESVSSAATPALPTKAIVFVAFNEDFNVADGIAPRAGGAAETRLLKELGRHDIEQRAGLGIPPYWTDEAAIAAAREAGANMLVRGDLRARHQQRIKHLTSDRWQLTLDVRVIRLADMRTRRIAVDPRDAVRPVNTAERIVGETDVIVEPERYSGRATVERQKLDPVGEYTGNGDEIGFLAGDAARQAVSAISALLVDEDEN